MLQKFKHSSDFLNIKHTCTIQFKTTEQSSKKDSSAKNSVHEQIDGPIQIGVTARNILRTMAFYDNFF